MRQNIEYGKDVEVPLLEYRICRGIACYAQFKGWGETL